MFIDNDGVALHVADDGQHDAPVVLVLHGITSCTTTWDWLVPHLVDTHRILRLDFRGHGQSGRAPGTYHFPSYLADAIAVCEQLAGGPAFVLGHSLGGGTAAALAQQRPDLVRGLLLEDPALASRDQLQGEHDGNTLLGAFQLIRQGVPRLQQSGMSVEQLTGIVAAGPRPAGGTLGDTMYPDAIRAMAVAMLQLDATVLDPVLDGSMITSFDPAATIPVPATVLAADAASPDAVVRAIDIERLAQYSPHVAVRMLAGAGHLIHDSLAHRNTLRDALLALLAVTNG